MIIALYPDHHHLPFWGKPPKNAKEVFDPEAHAGRLLKTHESRWVEEHKTSMLFPVGKRLDEFQWLWSLLMGFRAVDAPLLMGHISLFYNSGGGEEWWHGAYRMWAQISTLSEGWSGEGVPEIMADDGKTKLVQYVWADTSIYKTPYELIPASDRDQADAAYWENFFSEKIREAYRSYASKASEGYENAQRFWSISQVLASQALA